MQLGKYFIFINKNKTKVVGNYIVKEELNVDVEFSWSIRIGDKKLVC